VEEGGWYITVGPVIRQGVAVADGVDGPGGSCGCDGQSTRCAADLFGPDDREFAKGRQGTLFWASKVGGKGWVLYADVVWAIRRKGETSDIRCTGDIGGATIPESAVALR
jgi:hypothetical protein